MKKLCDPNVQNQIWTIISIGIFAAYGSVLVLITTRFVNLTTAGVLSYAMAVSELLRVIVIFGARTYQASDVRQEFGFLGYLGLRTFSTLLTVVIFSIFLIVGRFDAFKTIVMILYFAVYVTDMYADVFMSDLQQKGKMRIGGRMRASSLGAALIVYTLASVITRTVIIPLIFAEIVVLVVNVTWIWFYRDHFGTIRVRIDISEIIKLAYVCLPLLIYAIMSTYLINAQKYYLGAFGLYEDVAIFSMMMLPVSVYSMFCSFFFMGAELTRLAELFASGQLKRFSLKIRQQLLLITGLSLLMIICGYLFGMPLLKWLYDVDLLSYKSDFILLLAGGAFVGAGAALQNVLITMRQTRALLLSTTTVLIVSAPLMWFLVSRYGISGAAYSGLVINTPAAVLYYISYRIAMKRIVKRSVS